MSYVEKPILCLDFDGVCHSYTSGWKGANVIPDPPVTGMWEFLQEAIGLFEIHIFSSRTRKEGGKKAMFQWFLDHAETPWQEGIASMLIFPEEKPPALVTIDDRALTFTGKWPLVDEIREFKTWQGK